jgi:hypothetical protein
LFISDEALEISVDAIEDILEVGTVVTLKKVEKPNTEDESTITDNRSLYSEYYKQTKDETPVIEKTYDINAILTYSPSDDKLKSAGLDEECGVIVMLATYQLLNVGFANEEDTFHSLITDLKRGILVDINGETFIVKSVGMTGTLNGFSIICNLGCDLYA